MRGRRAGAAAAALALLTGPAGRWAALAVTGWLSLHYWTPPSYLAPAGFRQFQLLAVDPRVAAALLWSVQFGAVLVFILLPAAVWLAERLPARGPWARFAALVLAAGLGGRGITAGILFRAAAAAPAEMLPGGGEQVSSWLTDPVAARWVVAAAEAWWLLPCLVLILRALGPRGAAGPLRPLLLLYAVLQPIDAPYLLTAGGPQGATMNLQLLAFREGLGRQEGGYASALALLLCVAALAGVPFLRRLAAAGGGLAGSALPLDGDAAGQASRPAWLAAAVLAAAPFAAAALRNPALPASSPAAWGWAGTSLVFALAAAAWIAWLAPAAAGWLQGSGRWPAALLAPALFPPLVWALPLLRATLERDPGGHPLAAPAALVLASPYLYLGAFAFLAASWAGHGPARCRLAAAWVAAWAAWTDLSVPALLTRAPHDMALLPAGMLWSLSTWLWRSPLAVPGWPLAWAVGAALAWMAIRCLVAAPPRRGTPG